MLEAAWLGSRSSAKWQFERAQRGKRRRDAAEFNDELPDDIDDEEKYVALPDKRELGLGKPLVLRPRIFAGRCRRGP